MPEERWDDIFAVDDTRLDHCRLIWPSMALVSSMNTDFALTAATTNNEQDSQQLDMPVASDELREGILFLHPEIFAKMEPDIQSRFFTYEVTQAPQLQSVVNKTPHIKTYSRLMQKPSTPKPAEDGAAQDKEVSAAALSSCTCYHLAWTWLTSACLSRGAQGIHVPYSVCSSCGHIRSGYWDYKNFELGVLFHSNKDRQYRALCGTCPVHTSNNLKTAFVDEKEEKKLIILPFSYDIGEAKPFCNELNQLQRCPFFYPPGEVRKFVPECADEAELMMDEAELTRRSSSILGKRSHTMAEFVRSYTSAATASAATAFKRYSTGSMPSSGGVQSWVTSNITTSTTRSSLPFNSKVETNSSSLLYCKQFTFSVEPTAFVESKEILVSSTNIFPAIKREVISEDVTSISDFI